MFRHHGKGRTLAHNLRLATLLSFAAGMVNICGVFSVKTLTTNVTGHFAFFAEEIVLENYALAFTFIVYVLCFLFGSFLSGLLTEITARSRFNLSPALPPMVIESLVLILVWLYSYLYGTVGSNLHVIVSALLFAMGVQNSLVTQVSKSIVRTTHLTGLFTDLGIELAQLIFYRAPSEIKKLKQSIYLRAAIILFFFIGCIAGGFLFKYYELKTLLVASSFLILTLFYDLIRYKFYFLKRRLFTDN
ncbi:YoaK family protein [Albibacterium sp.]|uniref:YoaK family protein n=1 Tax=Albibacterium sp. TaxID=2952885 RepID=UPI002B802886|nr:YoaK family protein [Albibacterium sp.]HUH19578.1 YoaK family protein [Albibacterium sp.]